MKSKHDSNQNPDKSCTLIFLRNIRYHKLHCTFRINDAQVRSLGARIVKPVWCRIAQVCCCKTCVGILLALRLKISFFNLIDCLFLFLKRVSAIEYLYTPFCLFVPNQRLICVVSLIFSQNIAMYQILKLKV